MSVDAAANCAQLIAVFFVAAIVSFARTLPIFDETPRLPKYMRWAFIVPKSGLGLFVQISIVLGGVTLINEVGLILVINHSGTNGPVAPIAWVITAATGFILIVYATLAPVMAALLEGDSRGPEKVSKPPSPGNARRASRAPALRSSPVHRKRAK